MGDTGERAGQGGASFRRIKADVLRRIASGEWGPGGLLPAETELAAAYGCARATVNRALRELAEDGILERRRKSGTRVRPAPVRQARFEIPLIRREVEAIGAAYRHALVSRQERAAPDWLRARMGLADGAQALHLVCMHFADGAPFQHEDRWISLDALPQAREADFAAVGPNEWLVSAVPFSEVEIGLAAVAADAAVAGHLGCAEGAALFRVERTTRWKGQAITDVRLTYRPGHRLTSRY